MAELYDPDKPSTYAKRRRCGGCNWDFDLAREGMDEKDPNLGGERITLCGDCKGEAADEAADMAENFFRVAFQGVRDARAAAPKLTGRKEDGR